MSYLLANMEAARIIGDELRNEAADMHDGNGPIVAAIGRAFAVAADRMQEQMRAQCGDGDKGNV